MEKQIIQVETFIFSPCRAHSMMYAEGRWLFHIFPSVCPSVSAEFERDTEVKYI